MVKGLYTAYTGMINEQRRVDVLANNLANASTTGFKAEGSTSESFKEVLAYKIKDTSEAGTARKLGSMSPGVKLGETYTDWSEGSFHTTDNAYDMCISGKGFFTIEFTNGNDETKTMYTRDGSFKINLENEIVNANGDYLLDVDGKHITVDPLQDVLVGTDGIIYQNDQQVAQIAIADFEDYDYLKKYGETYYEAIEGATEVDPIATVHNGMLETSNVQVAKEMVNLINFQRAYETNQKMIQAHDETLQVAVNDLGQVR